MTDGQADLDDLRWHYGEAYLIDCLSGRWIAQRRDSHATMSADGPDELLEKIRADYARQPVGRQIAGAGRPQPLDCRFRPEG